MLRTLIISLWACSVTAGTLYYGLKESEEISPPETKEAHVDKRKTFSEPTIVFVPVVSMSKVTGYLFSNISVRADTRLLEESSIPINLLIQDSYLTYLAGNKDFALPNISKFDDHKLKMGVKHRLNEIAGVELVDVVFMSDINFLATREIRSDSGLIPFQLHEQAHDESKPEKPKTEPHN